MSHPKTRHFEFLNSTKQDILNNQKFLEIAAVLVRVCQVATINYLVVMNRCLWEVMIIGVVFVFENKTVWTEALLCLTYYTLKDYQSLENN